VKEVDGTHKLFPSAVVIQIEPVRHPGMDAKFRHVSGATSFGPSLTHRTNAEQSKHVKLSGAHVRSHGIGAIAGPAECHPVRIRPEIGVNGSRVTRRGFGGLRPVLEHKQDIVWCEVTSVTDIFQKFGEAPLRNFVLNPSLYFLCIPHDLVRF